MITIAKISTPEDTADTAKLIRAFTAWAISLDTDTSDAPTFKDLEAELATLPGVYAPPDGCFLLARQDGVPAGCVAFKPLGDGVVELKRMYVDPSLRGSGIGRKLVSDLIEAARASGAKRIVLDSHRAMEAAHGIYRSAGFVDVAPPAYFPADFVDRVVFMEMDLR